MLTVLYWCVKKIVLHPDLIVDLFLQALVRAGKLEDRVDDYVLVEDVHKSWDKKDQDKAGLQRILDPGEIVLQAQNRWKGSGKFILRVKSEVSHSGIVYQSNGLIYVVPRWRGSLPGAYRSQVGNT